MASAKQILRAILPRPVFNMLALIKRKLQDLLLLPAFYRRIPNPLEQIRELQGVEYGSVHLIVSLTTYYPRIRYILPTLRSLLKQNYPSYTIELNLRDNCLVPKRVQSFLSEHAERIRVCWIEGEVQDSDRKLFDNWSAVYTASIIKIAFTLRRHANTYIAYCDDDTLYHPYWLSTLYCNQIRHGENVAVGFTGYCSEGGLLVKKGLVVAPMQLEKEMPVIWLQGGAGCMLSSKLNTGLDLLEHLATCMRVNTKSLLVDDVVIGSWLYKLGIPRVIVPAPFPRRDNWRVPYAMTIYSSQVKHKEQTKQSIDEHIWETFCRHNLLAYSA